jgi:gliding motility-associated lipoprotein GldD
MFINEKERVYGILYDIKGNSASSLQFYLTDSSRHFFRGALYFNVQPNKDSLAPVIDYFREDIIYLIETFSWK